MSVHSLVKKKYVYNKALIHKVGWTARVNVAMKSSTVAYYDSPEIRSLVNHIKCYNL